MRTPPIPTLIRQVMPSENVVRQAPLPVYYGLAVTTKAAALLAVQRGATRSHVIRIERPGPALEEVADRILDLADKLESSDRIVIDIGSGLGGALWQALESPAHDRRYLAVSVQGRQRQAICDSLIAAVTRRLLTFEPGLVLEDDMRQALGSFRREITEDGSLGSELATALACALHVRRQLPPKVY